MEGPPPGESQDNEYMAMDPDQWEDQDDTYENGDTLGIDVGRRQVVALPRGSTQLATMASQQTNNTHNRPQNNSPPLPRRYMTLRWPLPKGNTGSEKTDQLVFFQRTMMGLTFLCLLLLAVMLALSVYDVLHYEKSHLELEETQKLLEEIGMWCGTRCYVSNTENQTSELYALNCEKFKDYMNQESFFLHLKNNSCNNSWQCDC